MEEQLVSFEVAKLAKEETFTFACTFYYDFSGSIGSSNKIINRINWNKSNDSIYSAPTQSLLQKWLRNKKVHVEAVPIDSWDSWGYNILMEDVMSPFFVAGYNSIEYKTYEEALEAGLLNALKLI